MTINIDDLVPEQLWQAIKPLLPTPPRRYGGRPRTDDRAALAGIVDQLRTGVPWRLQPGHLLAAAARLATRWRLAAAPPPAAGAAEPPGSAGLVARQPGFGQRARQAGAA